MSKLTLNPSDQVTSAARAEYEVTDATGRKITLKKPPFLAQFDLAAVIDDKQPGAGTLRMMVAPVLYVAGIDGDAVERPAGERELRALLQRLDEAGYQAVLEGITKHFTPANDNKDSQLKKS